MRTKYVMGNWKMNGSLSVIQDLAQKLRTELEALTQCKCVVFPPAIYLPFVQTILQDSSIRWGGQNCHPQEKGAFTGEHSCHMFADFSCQYVLVGHSERRHLFHEDRKFITEKFHSVKEHGMIPVLCVGETLEERQQGRTQEVLSRQLHDVIEGVQAASCFDDCIIAYEPVWAIGTGQTASPEQAQEMHQFIREVIARAGALNAAQVSIVYGGSVNAANAQALFSMPDIDGGLVGGASLDAGQFLEIVKCIKS